MNDRFRTTALATALMLAFGTVTPALAVDSNAADQDIQQSRTLEDTKGTPISALAIKVLREIAAARGDLNSDEPDLASAKNQLDQAETKLDSIQAMLPTTLIKDQIWVAKKHLEYEDTETVLPDLVPIYASLEELVDLMPTHQAKTHLDQAREAMKKGDKSAATEQLEAMDAALLYVEADLPLSSTRHLIAQAKADIAKEDAKAADQALASAESNVVFVSIGIESPLTQAKESLWRAWKDREIGRMDYAKAELDRAVSYLEQAAQSADKVTREAAAGLVSEVRELHGMLDTDEKSVALQLEQTWQETKALSERSAEYISTGWQRLRAGREDKKELIEAKLHLADARIDYQYSRDPDAAKAELAEAKGYLKAALPLVEKANKARVEAVIEEIAGLDQAITAGDRQASTPDAFQQAESGLADLIQQI